MSDTAPEMLRSYVRRIEAIEKEIKDLNDDKSEIYKEAKSGGFDVKVLRKVIAERRKDKDERNEFDSIFELYWNAIHGLVRAHVENIEEFDAETGEIAEPADAAVTAGNDLREPVAAEQGQIIREEDAPRETDRNFSGDASSPDTEFTNAPEPSNRDVSAGDEPSPEAGPQAEASPSREQDTGTLAGHEGVSEGEAAPVDLPTQSTVVQFNRDETTEERCLRLRPHCQNPSGCGSSVWNKHCFTCTKAVTSLEGGAA